MSEEILNICLREEKNVLKKAERMRNVNAEAQEKPKWYF